MPLGSRSRPPADNPPVQQAIVVFNNLESLHLGGDAGQTAFQQLGRAVPARRIIAMSLDHTHGVEQAAQRVVPFNGVPVSGRLRRESFPALRIDIAVGESAPAGWKGDHARESLVVNALFPILNRDRDATRALFEIVKNQPGYS